MSDQDEVEAALIGRAEAWQRAIERQDVTDVQEYLADDFALVLVQPNRAVMPRDQWLALLPNYVVTAYEVQERIVDVDRDFAVILQRARMEAAVLGADRSGVFVLTDVWRRRDGVWKIWRRHSTPLSAGLLPAPD